MSIILAIVSTSFIMTTHPVSMCFLLILSILTSSSMVWKVFNSFFPNFLVIMVYIGGMLVMFMYISSIAPNKTTKKGFQNSILFLLIPPIMIISFQNQTPTSSNMISSWSSNPEPLLFLIFILISIFLMIITLSLNPKLPMKSS